jgi:peroxiredoxin
MKLVLGDKIPNFDLKDQDKNNIQFSGFRGKKVLLSFHPLAWTSVCAQQMQSLENHLKEFEALNAVALGISVDTVPSKKAWADELGIRVTKLLSDFWPHGEYAKKLGIFLDKVGVSERANILVDENQKIIFFKVYEISKLPDINEILEFLQKQ